MKPGRFKRASRFLLIFIPAFFFCLAVTAAYIHNKSEMEFAKMNQLVMVQTNKVNNVLTKLLYKTQVLSALVIQNNGEIRDFDRVASITIDDPAIRNVILAPDGTVSHVYPLEGNEKVIGLDYFSQGDGNQEAVIAEKTGQLVLGGPFELVQGGQALVGRLPVYIANNGKKQFWGLVSVTLNYPQALDGAELEQLKNQGFAYEIWRISPDTNQRQIIANSSYHYNKNARYVEQPMKILNAEWYFRLSPIRSWYQYPETWIFSFTGLMLSLLLASLTLHNQDLRQMKHELEVLTYHDPLTGILNRRGIWEQLEKLSAEPHTRFVLCYMDINRFKSINDTYGHNTGDKVLQQFISVFQRHLDKHHIFARIGGDEFLLIIPGSDDVQAAQPLLTRIREDLLKSQITGHSQQIPIGFSYGIVSYPLDSTSLDELIVLADSAMYQMKQSVIS